MIELDQLRRVTNKIFHGPDHLHENGSCRNPPTWLVLVINNFCNLHCKMCDVGLGATETVFYEHLIGSDPSNLSVRSLEKLLEQASLFRPRPRIGLAYTEPLIHRDILEFCEIITGNSFFCSITTNGFLLPRLADQLVETGVDEIIVSADGPAQVHDRIRGKQGSFERLLEGVRRVNQARKRLGRKKPVIRFSYTLTDENIQAMISFVEAVKGLHPASINFSHLNFINKEMARQHNTLYPGELAITASNIGEMNLDSFDPIELHRSFSRLKGYLASTPGLPPVSIVPDLQNPDAFDTFYRDPISFIGGTRCTDPWQMMMVRTDGTVIPAHGRCYNIPVGNIHEEDLVDIWNGNRFRSFRQTLFQAGGTLPACSRCCGVIGKAND